MDQIADVFNRGWMMVSVLGLDLFCSSLPVQYGPGTVTEIPVWTDGTQTYSVKRSNCLSSLVFISTDEPLTFLLIVVTQNHRAHTFRTLWHRAASWLHTHQTWFLLG